MQNLYQNPLGTGEDFRISLAGVQKKTALLKWKGTWQIPLGDTPTTHIIKPAMGKMANGLDMSSSVHNEYFCMKLCSELGLDVAQVDLENFAGEIVLVVTRFDRVIEEGNICRKPQEDMCQALGYFSNKKYQADGGPSVEDLVSILQTSVSRQVDLETLFRSLVVFFVLGGVDGHGKNYSIQYVRQGHKLAPLYDILSIFSTLEKEKIIHGKYKMAMGIGKSNHYRADKVKRKHFLESAEICQVPPKRAEEVIDEVLSCIKDSVWNKISYSKYFDQKIKRKIVSGIKIVSSKLLRQ